MGPEMFLSLIPLNLDAEDPSEANLWLFPILKNYTVGAKLSFYCHTILPMIGPLKRKAQKVKQCEHRLIIYYHVYLLIWFFDFNIL